MTSVEMLTVTEALAKILGLVHVLEPIKLPLLASLGRILAEPVIAQESLPPFANSAMDGYAVISADIAAATPAQPISLRVVGDIPAGVWPDFSLTPGNAARIMTGAPLPPGADAIVPVEDTDETWRDRDRPLPAVIQIKRAVAAGDYIRHIGDDIQAGELILQPGRRLRPQEIGVLASLGIGQVHVIRPARVAILSTGDELLEVDQPLQPGKIRNSNSYALAAQVSACGATPVPLGIAGDTEAAVRARLETGLAAGVDLFVSSAGVSVGAYDVVKAVLEAEGQMEFWRVRMRPGKPLAFGRYAGVPYLGLPGNPVSALVSFERFVRPAILKMMGESTLERPQLRVKLQEALHSDGRESYLRAIVWREGNDYLATTTGGQGSHIQSSLVKANALVIVPEGVTETLPGQSLSALMIDWPPTVF